MSSTVSFFIGFRGDNLDDKIRSNRVIILNHIHRYRFRILDILNIFGLSNNPLKFLIFLILYFYQLYYSPELINLSIFEKKV